MKQIYNDMMMEQMMTGSSITKDTDLEFTRIASESTMKKIEKNNDNHINVKDGPIAMHVIDPKNDPVVDDEVMTKGAEHRENDDVTSGFAESHNHGNEIRIWLSDIVGFPQYVDNFISNGYDTMAVVEEINENNQLMEIGIRDTQHRVRILQEISQLSSDAKCQHDENKVEFVTLGE